MLALIKGFIISIALGVPAGPVGVLTIQNTLKSGFKSGLMTGLGSAAADIVFAAVGAFGVHFISDFLIENQDYIAVFGGLLLCFLGVYSLFKKPKQFQTSENQDFCSKENVIGFTSAFMISITNPATILAFMLAFSTFSLAENLTFFDASMLVLGVLIGAIVWWVTLAGLASKYKDRIKNNTNRILNVICGVIMTAFGIGMFVKTFIL